VAITAAGSGQPPPKSFVKKPPPRVATTSPSTTTSNCPGLPTWSSGSIPVLALISAARLAARSRYPQAWQ
jgi:hypothetical protein